MKTGQLKNFLLLAVASVFAVACTSAPDSDEAQVGDAKQENEVSAEAVAYAVDLNESVVEWVGTKTNGRHHGTVQLQSGILQVNDGVIEGGEFVLDMNTINDEDLKGESKGKLEGHLKSGDFFKVEEFPTARFVLTDVEATNETLEDEADSNQAAISEYRITNPTHYISGNLTIRDSTRGISFPAVVNMNEGNVSAIAKFNINRKDWGLKWEYPPGEVVLNNTIHLGINLAANKPGA